MMAEDRVTLAVDGGVARIRLARPPHNGIDRAMTVGLEDAVTGCATPGGLRAVLIAADGRNFSVGGDLSALVDAGDGVGPHLDDLIGRYHRTLLQLADLPVPVVCAAQGAVAGGALGLLWASDVVIAADDLRLTTAFSAIGLTGDGGSSWYLPRLVGLRKALELVMETRVLDAAEAEDLGLVSTVVPVDDLDATAETAAARLAAGPTAALGAIRRLYRQGLTRGLGDQLTAEQEVIVAAISSDDAREGIAAFAERRPARFTGR